MSRESMSFDVVIVGGGPAGLAASIELAKLAKQTEQPLEICLIDKAENIGGHIVSGAVLEPRALNELLPDWQQRHPPAFTPAKQDEFLLLSSSKAYKLPTPPQMKNHGNYIISLSQFCRWLGDQAEAMGVNIFPGFAATECIYDSGKVVGIITGDKGVDQNHQKKENYQQGFELRAKQVVLAEGCRGSLTESIVKAFNLRKNTNPQTYALGIKEVWDIPKALHQPGKVSHTIGWPLDRHTYGGGFLYHFDKNLLSIGFVVGLDYKNPYLNPYEEFQRFKTHPRFTPLLKDSKRIAYAARTLIEGGIQSLPELVFPGGLIIGDAAGFLNVPKIKGIHNAMKSGMVAAKAIFDNLDKDDKAIQAYSNQMKSSWVWQELYKVRNIRPAMRWGLILGVIYSAIDTYMFRGCAPWTFKYNISDRQATLRAKDCQPISYPKHDNQITFDITRSIYLTNVAYDENQPCHLRLADRQSVPIEVNYNQYASPETRYCPANVYEIVNDADNKPYLQINNGNCIHCKACDIKDPTDNIHWMPSEGGSGPNYELT